MLTFTIITIVALALLAMLGIVEGEGGKIRFAEQREKFAKLQKEAQDVIDAAQNAEGGPRELTKEEAEANEKRFSQMEAIRKNIDADLKFAKMKLGEALNEPVTETGADGEEKATGEIQLPKDAPGKDEFNRSRESGGGSTSIRVGESKFDRQAFTKALAQWGLTGIMDRRFATITTTTQSGVLMPKSVMRPIVPMAKNAIREAMAAVGVTPIETSGTDDLSMPVLDTAAGSVVAEDASSETENEPSLAESFSLNVSAYQSGSAWFSKKQLLATGFDILNYVETQLQYSKELALEKAIMDGITADAGITQLVNTATTSGLTYDNLVDLNLKLPKRYQQLKAIVLSQDAYAAAEKLVGSDGHPVLNLDPQVDYVKRFNGTPVVRSDYLGTLAAGHTVGFVVSFLGFMLRDVTTQELARYENQPAKPAQIGLDLIGWHGWGYPVSAIATLETPAS